MSNEKTDENHAVVLICDPKHVWFSSVFSSVFSLGIKTHARDEFSHFLLAIKLMNC